MTYAQARVILIKYWHQADGCEMQEKSKVAPWGLLKVPYVTKGSSRYYIKKQAILECHGGAPFDMGKARSTNWDMRVLAVKALKTQEGKK